MTSKNMSMSGDLPTFETLEPRLLLSGSVIVSEFMASNDSTLLDGDGAYSDWIELYNDSQSDVDLAGWFLSDDNNDVDQWEFPTGGPLDIVLGPGEHLVVFASGQDDIDYPYNDGTSYHTNFKLSATNGNEDVVLSDPTQLVVHNITNFPDQFGDISYGIAQDITTTEFVASGADAKYLVGVGNPGAWTGIAYNDTSWTDAQTGIGYADLTPGFDVKTYTQPGTAIANLSIALQIVDVPGNEIASENAAVFNYFNSDNHGHYSTLESQFPGLTGTADDFAVEANALVTIPTAGSYSFGVNSDDGFQLTISGATTSAVNNSSTPVGSDTISYANPRGANDTIGVFDFAQAGDYQLSLVYYERGGGASAELFAAPGVYTSFNSGVFDLVGDTANGGLEVWNDGGGGHRSLLEPDHHRHRE